MTPTRSEAVAALHALGFTKGEARRIVEVGFDAAFSGPDNYRTAARERRMALIRWAVTGLEPGLARGILAAIIRDLPRHRDALVRFDSDEGGRP